MNWRFGSSALAVTALVATGLTGCSGSHDSAATSSSSVPPATTTASSPYGTSRASSASASQETKSVTHEKTVPTDVGQKKSGGAHVGVVIDERFQAIPRPLKKVGTDELLLDGTLDEQGAFSGVKAGTKLKVADLTQPVSVAWLSKDAALAVDSLQACTQCRELTAPSSASYVLVQPASAGPMKIEEGASIKIQMTQVNTPANRKSGRATSTEAPSG